MRMYDILLKKRRGFELTNDEIDFFIQGYTRGEIPDYQASAFCMAVCYSGMTENEITALTMSMANSGDMVDLTRFGNLTVDKHSTGGVGDKTSLIICPIVASLGGRVAKMSGRGLGHTGGTVDKLEAIPGYRTSMSMDEFMDQVETVGLALIGQTGNLAPADKKLYALRDVTATVDCMPLITSSIMSKKIAAGSKNIVLDVKTGSGAFMKTLDDSVELANNMVRIGKACGRNVTAVITDMDTPLGYNIGNSLEVIEAVKVLNGCQKDDLYEVSVALAAEMTSLFMNISANEAKALVEDSIESGKAISKMVEWVKAQGGDPSFIIDPDKFRTCTYKYDVIANEDGYIGAMNAEEIGKAACILGAGRITKDDKIDPEAGIILAKKKGDHFGKGDLLATLYTDKKDTLSSASEIFLGALTLSSAEPEMTPLIAKIIR
ncbi:MAG: thymidine phosphorylase [Clostridia bacterium]|nr:thymidine phosphorylase [Clostridia bacterium]